MIEKIHDEAHLDELLSEPSPQAIETLAKLDGDLAILGVGGKMGPTLARMAVRAFRESGSKRKVLGIARFSQKGLEEQLQSWGVETIRCDLLDRSQVAKLPQSPNVLGMTGMKFGSTGQEALTWAMNVLVPAHICEHYRHSKVVAFSSGNVYGLTPVRRGGSLETDVCHPHGDYSQSALGRERIYEHFGRSASMPMVLLRLNYATEMRYGVLVDVARKVQAGEPIDLAMGHLNAIWQGDANAMTLCAFGQVSTPPRILNIAGPEILSVAQVAQEFGRRFGTPAKLIGEEGVDAYLSNAQVSHALYGYPRVSVWRMIDWIADWVGRGGRSLGKPTRFEVRDGKY